MTTCGGSAGSSRWPTSPGPTPGEFLEIAGEIGIATNPTLYPLERASAALADLEAGRIGAGAAVLLPEGRESPR